MTRGRHLSPGLRAVVVVAALSTCVCAHDAHAQAWQMWIHSGGTTTRILTSRIDSVTFVFADTTRPASPILVANAVSSSSIRLDWTAVGDDGDTGIAAAYDLRYSTTSGTPFASMTSAGPLPPPKSPGSPETVTVSGLNPGSTYYFVLGVSDDFGNVAYSSEVGGNTLRPGPHGPVIAEVYGAGGGAGATYLNDYVVLFNPQDVPQSLSGCSLQRATASATTWTVMNLSGTIAPHGYFLVQLASGGPEGAALPTPDLVGTLNLGSAAGKVLFAPYQSPDSFCGFNSAWDLVGYGSTVNPPGCWEGPTPAPGPSETTAIIRVGGGCTDTDNNGANFVVGTPTPRNSASPPHTCP